MVKAGTIFPSGNILDIILCSHRFRIGSCEVLAPLPHCSHCPIVCTYVFQDLFIHSNNNNSVKKFIWPRGRYDLIGRSLQDIDWADEFHLLDAQQQFARLLFSAASC